MELSIYNKEGNDTGRKVKLDDSVFGVAPNEHVMWLDVKQILANRRQGTHSTLEKSQVSGSTKKLKRQKGTGGARAGSIKSGTIVGGARIFGPHPRDYGFKLNQKVKVLARKSALSAKAKNNAITIIENFSMDTPKTSVFADMIKKLNMVGQKTLFVTGEYNKNIFLSGRNLEKSKVIYASNLNTYDVLKAGRIIVMEDAINNIVTLLNR